MCFLWLCDKKFLSCGIGDYDEGEFVTISLDEINQYLKTTKDIITIIGKKYEQVYIDETIKEIENMSTF